MNLIREKDIKKNRFLDMNKIAEVNSYIVSIEGLIVKKGYDVGNPPHISSTSIQSYFNSFTTTENMLLKNEE